MKSYLFTLVVVVCLLGAVSPSWAVGFGIDVPSYEFPPEGGVYISPYDYHEYSALGIVLDDLYLKPIASTTVRDAIGNDERETFLAESTALEIGFGLGPVMLTGPVEIVTYNRLLSSTGMFDAEIVSMSLSGNTPSGPIEIRQDPNRRSTGQTNIMDLGGGLYHIDSFFDVFTEMSPDGGASWIPCDYPTHMILVPEPCSMVLLGLGGLSLLKRRRK